MNETKYRITITNLDEAQKKADELVRSLQQAKQLIRDISEMPLGIESTETYYEDSQKKAQAIAKIINQISDLAEEADDLLSINSKKHQSVSSISNH